MSRTISLTIDTDGAAFGDTYEASNAEVARILREAADRVESGEFSGDFSLRDINGNTVGHLTE